MELVYSSEKDKKLLEEVIENLSEKEFNESGKLIIKNVFEIKSVRQFNFNRGKKTSFFEEFYKFSKENENECFFVYFVGRASNLDFLKEIILNWFSSKNVILIGVGEISFEFSQFVKENNLRVYFMKDLINYEDICDIVMERVRDGFGMIGVDINVLDNSINKK